LSTPASLIQAAALTSVFKQDFIDPDDRFDVGEVRKISHQLASAAPWDERRSE
jgi:hypothetical protein